MWPNVGHGWRTGRWTNGRSGHLTRIMCHERKWLTRHPSHRMFGKMQRNTPLQPLRLAWQKAFGEPARSSVLNGLFLN